MWEKTQLLRIFLRKTRNLEGEETDDVACSFFLGSE